MMNDATMNPLRCLIASRTKIVLVDDNARSHAVPTPVADPESSSNYSNNNKKSTSCRWQSSPVHVRKPGILASSSSMNNAVVAKRSSGAGLSPSSMTSLKSLVAPFQRQRTIPMIDIDNDIMSSSSSNNTDDSRREQTHYVSNQHRRPQQQRHGNDYNNIQEEALELNEKITKASELLSEYLRVATEELCLESYVSSYSDYNHTTSSSNSDDRTVSTATVSSHSTADSASSHRSMGSLTHNVRKPVRQRSRDNVLTENVVEC